MHVFTIAWRELRSYFTTTMGWLVLAGFLFIAGFFWWVHVESYVVQSTDLVSNPYASQQMNLTDYLLSPFFSNVGVILLMLCPAISMRLFSDELKHRTMELLLTSPVGTMEIVLGKFLGALGFVAVMLLGTAYVPFTLWLWSNPDWGVLIGGYLAVLMLAGAMLAMGTLFSASTQSAMVAMVSTFGAGLGLWLLSWDPSGSGDEKWRTQLSLVTHMEDPLRGVIQLHDVVYYVAFIAFFLFAAHQRVEGYRWR